ncbi:MAG: hypothetical protein WAS07_05700, partial [Micropruina sp.]
AGSGRAKITAKCAGLLREYGWQDQDAAARSGVRDALATAEANLARYLGYPVLPTYREVTLPYPRLGDLRLQRYAPAGADGRRLTVQLPESHLIALGVEARTAIGDVGLVGVIPYVGASPAAPYLIYRDWDNDGIPDQFEVAIATTVTDPREIAVYVAAADRWDGSDLSERWRLLPARVSISGGVATITGPAWVCARPVLWEGEGVTLNGLAPEDGSNYLQSLTIARRYTTAGGTTTATAQAVLTWESPPWPAWACCPGVGSDPASYAQAVARVGIRDAANGIVTPAQAVYDAGTGVWSEVTAWNGWACREPDRVTIRYLAGVLPNDDGTPVEPWASIICRLAAADLARPVCSCQESNKGIAIYQQDVSQTGATNALFQAPDDIGNPLGTRRGQILAWRAITRARFTPGFSL